MPSPLRSAILHQQNTFINLNRGTIRARNDKSFENRATHFSN
jgi:hypothetical protein